MTRVSDAIKHKSALTKEEWREYTKTVWSIANVSHGAHPAVFPLEIPHRLIKLFSFHGETILDPFAGVGTTARAGIPLGRRVVCVDQSRRYVNIIKKECARVHNGHEILEQSRLWQLQKQSWQRSELWRVPCRDSTRV